MATTGRAVGVDFGTTTSLAAEGDASLGVTLAPVGELTNYMPSVVGVTDHALLAGERALDLPERQIVRSIKRAITERKTVLDHPLVPHATLQVDDAIVTVLRELFSRTRSFGIELTDDVLRLGCPAMWDSAQRTRLLDLARKAGIPVAEHTLVDEPIAAGMAWVSYRVREHREKIRGRVLVFDMGGGTLDIALLQVDTGSGLHGEISVLASAGLNEAGDQLDVAIRDQLAEQLLDLGLDPQTVARPELTKQLLMSALEAKEMLSSQDRVLVAVPHPSIRLPNLSYSREQLETVFAGQLRRAEELTWAVVRESYLTHEVHDSPSEIRQKSIADLSQGVTSVLLVGGMSRIPAVRQLLESMFPDARVYDHAGVGPDEAVVAGLAETTAYDRVNLHRPPFDFVLEVPGAEDILLYEAYSRLYSPAEAMQRSMLYYEQLAPARLLPQRGTAKLKVRSAMGNDVTFMVDGRTVDGLPVDLGHKDVRLRIRPNGYIGITNGRGRRQHLRVDRWPVLRGRDHAMIQMRRVEHPGKQLGQRLPWWLDPNKE